MAEADEIAALTARVAALEETVAALGGWVRRVPERREVAAAPPPLVNLPQILPTTSVPRVNLVSDLNRAWSGGVTAKVVGAKGETSLESRLGAQVFNVVGILALVIATAYGLKLAIEHGYLGPVARVLMGIVAGVGVVVVSERLRRREMAAYSYSLKAVGSAVLYLSLWAAFQLYHLLPAGVALGAMALVTAWNAYMAWAQDSEVLAAYALAGGFLTPLLLSTGGDHEVFLFVYLGGIDVALVGLLRVKGWRRLVLPAFAVTVAYFIGWYAEFFRETAGWTGQSTATALFAVGFASVFALVPVLGKEEKNGGRGDVIVPVLLPLGYAVFEGLALYSVFVDSGLRAGLPWLMVGLAAVYLGLMQVQRGSVARAMHLAMAVVFLTVAIPFKASGHALTTAWLVEGLVLYWASTRFAVEERQAAGVLRGLAGAGFVLGLGSLVARWFFLGVFGMEGFWNRNLGAAAVAVGTLAGVVWLGRRVKGVDVVLGLVGIDVVAALLGWREVASTWAEVGRHAAFVNASFATAVVGLGVLAGVAWVAYRLGVMKVAGVTVVGFNLLAILSVEREIGALWQRGVDDLQRSLAISGFLMVYGVGLLGVGFWKRSSFARWQALVLLVFTICKVFLNDIGGLSAGYRVASFMGLGVVLMGVSYAYQKDWLGLKDAGVEG